MDRGPCPGLTRSGPGEIPANKVKHVVVILKENHTFDNYFGTFPGANGARLPRSPNPPARDHPHTHAAWLARQTTAAREQFVEQDIPAYFSYGRKFCLCDNYYTDVAGPSTPNHLMLLCADSPIIDNPSRRTPQTIKIDTSLPKSLEQSRLTWRSYGGFFPVEILEGWIKARPHQYAPTFLECSTLRPRKTPGRRLRRRDVALACLGSP